MKTNPTQCFTKKNEFGFALFGGPKGDRTPDLQIANLALSQLSYGPLCTYFSLFGGIFLSHLGSQLSYGPLFFVILSQQTSPVNSFLSTKGASRYQDAPFQFTLRQDRSVPQSQSHRYERGPRLPRHTGRSFRLRDVRYTVHSWRPQLQMPAVR